MDCLLASMPRDDDFVQRDSKKKLWEIVERGLYANDEVTASFHWAPAPHSPPTQWVANIQKATPFGRQSKSWTPLEPPPKSPPVVPPPVVPPPVVRMPLHDVEINILKKELADEDAKRAVRAAARLNVEKALKQLWLAEEL